MKVFYDGDCYFCKNYAEFAKLRSQVGEVELISLRSEHPEIEAIRARGFKVNRGFVVEHDGVWLEGDKAFGYLNLLMRGNGIAQKLLINIAKRPRLGALFYRCLVLGRYMVLALQGLTLIDLDSTSKPSRYRHVARVTRLGLALSIPILLFSMAPHFLAGDRWRGLYSVLVFVLVTTVYLWSIRKNENVENALRILSSGRWQPFLILLVGYLFVVNAGSPLSLRRFLGFFLSAPVWGLFVLYGVRYFRRSSPRSWLAWLPAAAFLFAAVPGFIAGPFYGGIAGWVIRYDATKPVTISGYKLVNSQGQKHWLNHAIFQPHGQIGRFRRAYRAMPDTKEEDFVRFAFETYLRIYPGITRGHYPHQWALGDFAYPTHSLQKYNTEILADNFAPDNVVSIERVVEEYDFSGNLIERRVIMIYEVDELNPTYSGSH